MTMSIQMSTPIRRSEIISGLDLECTAYQSRQDYAAVLCSRCAKGCHV